MTPLIVFGEFAPGHWSRARCNLSAFFVTRQDPDGDASGRLEGATRRCLALSRRFKTLPAALLRAIIDYD